MNIYLSNFNMVLTSTGVASADSAGKVRVWSWDNPEHLLKVEVPALAGAVLDLGKAAHW